MPIALLVLCGFIAWMAGKDGYSGYNGYNGYKRAKTQRQARVRPAYSAFNGQAVRSRRQGVPVPAAANEGCAAAGLPVRLPALHRPFEDRIGPDFAGGAGGANRRAEPAESQGRFRDVW